MNNKQTIDRLTNSINHRQTDRPAARPTDISTSRPTNWHNQTTN